jgi:hypothetical protein
MNEQQAQAIADALGGETWQSGGDIWLVTLRRNDGKVVVISDDAICLYADDEAFDAGQALQSIELHAGTLSPDRR